MKVRIHPDAVRVFNDRAIRLIDSVQLQNGFDKKAQGNYQPNTQPAGIIEEKDIGGPIIMEEVNPVSFTGHDVAFTVKGRVGYLRGADADDLRSLALSVSRCGELRGKVGEEFVKTEVINWIVMTMEGGGEKHFAEYIQETAERRIQAYEIRIPIANLHVESDLTLGSVTFSTISSDFLDKREEEYLAKAHENWGDVQHDEFSTLKAKLRKDREKYQGFAAGVCCVEAEESRAVQTALAEVEDALGLLRILNPVNASWRACSHCRIMGSEGYHGFKSFVLLEGERQFEREALRVSRPDSWMLSDERVASSASFLGALNEILTEARPSPFQQKIISSMKLYSRANIKLDPVDKLVYVLVALETLLLRGGESVQQNIAERFAFLFTQEAGERKDLIRLVKSVYDLRSRFVHHGEVPSEWRDLEAFLLKAWIFFMWLPTLHRKFQTVEDLHSHLERVKLS